MDASGVVLLPDTSNDACALGTVALFNFRTRPGWRSPGRCVGTPPGVLYAFEASFTAPVSTVPTVEAFLSSSCRPAGERKK